MGQTLALRGDSAHGENCPGAGSGFLTVWEQHPQPVGYSMTRFGVMKHLKQLEEAGLVVTKRRGREKLHLLNPVPIRLVHDRWVSNYAEPWAASLSGLKNRLESGLDARLPLRDDSRGRPRASGRSGEP